MSEDGPEPVEWIPDDQWETIVRNVPIVSVDLVVLTDDGVVLAKRTNEPVKGEWFVPGGRVRKGERLEDAVHRVARKELGIEIEIVESLGAYEHLYRESDVDASGGKHYLANGFVVRTDSREFTIDDQHGDVQVFEEIPNNLHQYVEKYVQAATAVNR
jgi:colanic acid biosynthesis protein WcaH